MIVCYITNGVRELLINYEYTELWHVTIVTLHKYKQVFPYNTSHHEFIDVLEWTSFIFPVVAAHCFPVSEAGGEPGILSTLIGVHPELEKK